MKELRQQMFAILAKMEKREEKLELKNNNSLKELKCSVNVVLTLMSEVCGKKIGRKASFKKFNLKDYQDMAYYIAHTYRKKMYFKDNFETEQVFQQMVDAGVEGLVQGFSKFDSTKNAKMTTFLFNRVKYAVSKYVQKLLRDKKKKTISLNLNVSENTELEEIFKIETPNIVEIASKNIRKEALLKAMDKMSEFKRTVLQLYSTNSLTYTAKKTNITVQNVKDIITEMRAKVNIELKQML